MYVSIFFSLKQTFSDGLVTQNLDGFWKCHRAIHHFGQSCGTSSMYLFLMIFSHSLAMSKHDPYSKIILKVGKYLYAQYFALNEEKSCSNCYEPIDSR